MQASYIALSVPVFFLLIGLELWLNRRGGRLRYAFQDSITNLSCGVGQQVLGLLFRAATVVGYVYVYEHWALLRITPGPRQILAWVVLLFGVDLCYYVFHRAAHRINLMWAGHIVHHQSEEMNLSVALRQSWFLQLGGWVFYLPLALVGFPPVMYLTMSTFNTLYQFWIHLGAVGKLGPLEWIMNTPSHHRVHHGINPKYIDKNYAGVFIIWDRLFGTFQEEEDEPVYGTVKPLASWNPLWANTHYFFEMLSLARRSPAWLDSVRVWFMPPEWRPAALGGRAEIPEVSRGTQHKYGCPVRGALNLYVLVQFVLVVAATTLLLLTFAKTPRWQLAAAVTLILATLVSWGALFESRRWAWPFEALRLSCAAGLAIVVLRGLA